MVFPILGSGDSSAAGYDIENSLRFNDDDSPYLNKTFGSAGSRRIFTISFWMKLAEIATSAQHIFFSGSGTTYADIHINSQLLNFASEHDGAGTVFRLQTNRIFRDPSAWYHVVIGVNTTLGTAASRMDMFINGVEETSFATATYPAQNLDTTWTNSVSHEIGGYDSSQTISNEYDGYLADFYFIDGTYDSGSGGNNGASAFGEFDDSGTWKPKEYAGSYGTNGFFLEFKQSGVGAGSSSTVGADTSGNDHHFTSNAMASTDQTTDTPTNNFCTLNPLENKFSATLSEGNTQNQTRSDNSTNGLVYGTMGVQNGKWYWEVQIASTGSGQSHSAIGIAGDDSLHRGWLGEGTNQRAVLGHQGNKVSNGSSPTSYGSAMSGGSDICSVALDMDNGKIWFAKNGTWFASGDPAAGSNAAFDDLLSSGNFGSGTFCLPAIADNNYGDAILFKCNFGGTSAFTVSSGNADGNGYGNFEYAPPSGFYALCTKNLAEYG